MINLFHSGGCHDSCCLKVQNVTVKIGGDRILKDVNLHVHCGQLVALIGPNGAGKSTLLKTLLGEREFDGNIIFSVPGARRAKARIGYVHRNIFNYAGYFNLFVNQDLNLFLSFTLGFINSQCRSTHTKQHHHITYGLETVEQVVGHTAGAESNQTRCKCYCNTAGFFTAAHKHYHRNTESDKRTDKNKQADYTVFERNLK